MVNGFTLGLLLVVAGALLGGVLAKLLKTEIIVGYILSGVLVGSLFSISSHELSQLADLGAILLLFSIGLTLSLSKLGKNIKKIVLASVLQILLATGVLYLAFNLLGLGFNQSLILAMGFSLSSTAVVIKVLSDKAETETIHGKLMIGWLLVQDLAVVPMMILLPILKNSSLESLWSTLGISVFKAVTLVLVSVILGSKVVPEIIHRVAKLNSRELLVLTSVFLAVGTAYGVTLLGVSATLGAFLAGLVISESQENHAVFAETRPLRDLFVAMFFVSLGLSLNFGLALANWKMVLGFAGLILFVKLAVLLTTMLLAKIRGKTLLFASLGLTQVGEFAFVLFALAGNLNLLTPEISSVAVSSSLLTLLLTPIIFRVSTPLWRKLKRFAIFSSNERNLAEESDLNNHIIICGYGRVGGWVGKALQGYDLPFVVIEYDWGTANDLKKKGTPVVYGDPTEPEILDSVNLGSAKAVVIAIPDRLAQETLIAYVQTKAPGVKIISRVHLDEDFEKLKSLRVDKLVQPEFEAASEIVRNILSSMGKDKDEVRNTLKNLRLSHAKI